MAVVDTNTNTIKGPEEQVKKLHRIIGALRIKNSNRYWVCIAWVVWNIYTSPAATTWYVLDEEIREYTSPDAIVWEWVHY